MAGWFDVCKGCSDREVVAQALNACAEKDCAHCLYQGGGNYLPQAAAEGCSKDVTERGDPMKTFEDYKAELLDQPSQHLREKLLAQAEADGYDAWALAELAGVRAELWAKKTPRQASHT